MHREALRQVDLFCTSCRTFEGGVTQHRLAALAEETAGDYIISGWLECPHCRKRYPIAHGVPQMIDLSSGVASDWMNDEDLISEYLDAHYGTLNAGYWRQMKMARGRGLSLDVGCSVGRYTFECARRGFAVGIDVNVEHLRLATAFQRAGKISYIRKTRALCSEDIESPFIPSKSALFVLADVHNPPFQMETFDFISALNVVDSVRHPLTALGQMDAMLKPAGKLFLSTPYVWNPQVSAEWLETAETDPHSFVKRLLTGKEVPQCGFNYRIDFEKVNIPWRLRRQNALQFAYLADAIMAEKLSPQDSSFA